MDRSWWGLPLAAALAGCAGPEVAPPAPVSFVEQRLAEPPADAKILRDPFTALGPCWSATGRGVLIPIDQGGQRHMVVNDRVGPPFTQLQGGFAPHAGHVFDREGRRAAYRAQRDTKWFVVDFEGNVSDPFDDVSSLDASPDDALAWVGKLGSKYFVVHDGDEGELWDEVPPQRLFDPSGRLAYVARSAEGWFAVLDGDRFGPYEQAERARSQGYATMLLRRGAIVRQGAKSRFLDVEGPGEPWDEIVPQFVDWGWFTRSSIDEPDGPVYAARDGERWFLVGGAEGKRELVPVELPVLARGVARLPDGRWVAFKPGHGAAQVKEWHLLGLLADGRPVVQATRADGKALVALGMEWGASWDGVGRVHVDPAGREVAYAAERKSPHPTDPSKTASTWFVCTTKGDRGPFDAAHVLAITPAGAVPYVATQTGERWTFEGGPAIDPDPKGMSHPFWEASPDGKVVAVAVAVRTRAATSYEPDAQVLVLLDDAGARRYERKGPGEVRWLKVSSAGTAVVELEFLPAGRDPFLGYDSVLWDGVRTTGPFVDVDYHYHFSADGGKVAVGAQVGREFCWKVLELSR